MASQSLEVFTFEGSQETRVMKIELEECTIIRPKGKTPNETLPLSKLDLVHRSMHVTTVKFYKPNGDSNFFEPNLLKESLRKTLVEFYPLAGRFARDENGRLEVNCNGEGVLFIVAKTDIAMSVLGDFLPSKELELLVPKIDYLNVDITDYPLLLAQVTRLECGGVALGLGLHHNFTDGSTAAHFMNSWACVCRGIPNTTPPFFDRAIFCPRSPPNPTFHHPEYDPPPSLNNPETNSPKSHSIELLQITPEQLNTLKAKARGGDTATKYSTYQVLAAHIWRCASKARNLSHDQQTKLHITTDARSRFQPPLRPGYFGNVTFNATPIASSGDLITEPFRESVDRIQKVIRRMDDEYLRSSLDYLEQQENMKSIVRSAHTCKSPNLTIVSWVRLPFHEIDFGWGNPVCVRPTTAFEGKGYILPSPVNDGSLSLFICLRTNHMSSFKKLFYVV